MDELTLKWGIVSLLVGAGIAFWRLGRRSDQRRDAAFAALASSFGAKVVRESEGRMRFEVPMDRKVAEVRFQRMGGGIGSETNGAWYFVTEFPLESVGDIYSIDFRRRLGKVPHGAATAEEFARSVDVLDLGFKPREGWLNDRVRSAVAEIFSLKLPFDRLSVERGKLVQRSFLRPKQLDRSKVADLLDRQSKAAEALERAL